MVKQTRLARTRIGKIRKLADKIQEQQIDEDTPPAELGDITSLLQLISLELERLDKQIKELVND